MAQQILTRKALRENSAWIDGYPPLYYKDRELYDFIKKVMYYARSKKTLDVRELMDIKFKRRYLKLDDMENVWASMKEFDGDEYYPFYT